LWWSWWWNPDVRLRLLAVGRALFRAGTMMSPLYPVPMPAEERPKLARPPAGHPERVDENWSPTPVERALFSQLEPPGHRWR
jgi:hypothetical protein